MNNLSSYCEFIGARISASEIDLPVQENGDFAMWHQEAKFNPYWVIGKLDGSNDDIQTLTVSGKDPSLCPNDENNHWAMNMLESEEDTPSQYQNSYKWVSIDDQISMKCKGKQYLNNDLTTFKGCLRERCNLADGRNSLKFCSLHVGGRFVIHHIFSSI